MKTILTRVSAISVLLATGCATQPVGTFEPFQATDLNPLLASGLYQQKTNNFFVIADSSSSMSDNFQGPGLISSQTPNKFAVEKEILTMINQTIPDLKLTAGIRSFGFGPCTSWSSTLLNLAPTNYSKSTFGSGIDALTCSSGGSPLASAIEESASDLSTASGKIAVLILSDGHNLYPDPAPSLQALKQQYGDRLCVYSVWIGNPDEDQGKRVLNQLSDIAGCGYRAQLENIATGSGMSQFVQNIFLKQAAPTCVSMDSDADGVNDCDDRCPASLKGAHVNRFGCWIVDIKFDNDKSKIKPQYFSELDNAAGVILNNPGVHIEVQGHTSNTGTVRHNQALSEWRAREVANYLKNKIGDKAILTSRGYGLTQPVDTNETEEGRAINRRVELKIVQ